MSQSICSAVEFSERDYFIFEHDRCCFWCLLHLQLDQVMNASVFGILALRIVPFNQQLMPFGLSEQWKVTQLLFRIGDNACQKRAQVVLYTGNCRGIK